MGQKGDKLTQESVITAEALEEKLAAISGISSKRMFGGHGVFHEGKMFCIIDSRGKTYMKVNDSTKADYEAKGAVQHSRMPYFSIPNEVLNDPELLISWTNKSIAISK